MSSNIKPCAAVTETPAPPVKGRLLEKLTRNVAIATAVLLGVVVLRNTSANGGDIVQTVKNIVESE